MSEICTICGLPKDLCVCASIAKESQRIVIKTEQRKFRKNYTIIVGIDFKQINAKDLVKNLKNKFACGGTIKDGRVELQGDHKSRAKKVLVDLGFPPEAIDVK